MLIDGKPYRTIWENDDGTISIIDQRYLPFQLIIERIRSVEQMATAIKEMHVRGAVLIGAAAAYGMVLAGEEARNRSNPIQYLNEAADLLLRTRPTAINLRWAIYQQMRCIQSVSEKEMIPKLLRQTARRIVREELERCIAIGNFGKTVLEDLSTQKETLNILLHCNAGWLGCIDYGTATAPIYRAHEAGIPLHIWVDETRPRNQGARLTAWELLQQGIPHTVITDNAAAHLMQHKRIDCVIIGADRITRTGDVANKIGSLEKAICAHYFHIPFFVAAPTSSIHWEITDGVTEIPIEERSSDEVHYVEGWHEGTDSFQKIRITPYGSAALNPAFDVTPATLITGIITEVGIISPTEEQLQKIRITESIQSTTEQ